MKPSDIKLLRRIYTATNNSTWDHQAALAVYRLPDEIPEKDAAALTNGGWLPGQIESHDHDSCLARLIAARASEAHKWPVVARRFLAGISGTSPRGCASVLDYLAMRDLAPHAHRGTGACDVCALPQHWSHDKTQVLMSAYMGHAGSEVVKHVIVRVEETQADVTDDAVAAGRACLADLIAVASEAAPDETPSALEKRVAKAKVLPKTEKYKRYGILQTLAECGILPNDHLPPAYEVPRTLAEFLAAHQGLAGSPRSDIVLPFGGWRGRNGADAAKAAALFGAA